MIFQRNVNHKIFGMYNGCRPFSAPMELVDTWPTDNRVNPWIMWKDTIAMCFQWATADYAGDTRSSGAGWNIWENPYTGNLPNSAYWNGGNLIYCGKDAKYPLDSRGLDFPIAWIRLKNMRRGIQDYEYLWLAQKDGLSSAISKAVDSIVPAAFNRNSNNIRDTSEYRQPYWCQDGYKFERVRQNLATALDPSAGTINQGNLKGDISGNSIVLNWSSVPNVSKYSVLRNDTVINPNLSPSTLTTTDANIIGNFARSALIRYAVVPYDGSSQPLDKLATNAIVPSPLITSDTTWSGAVYLHNSVIIASGKTVTVLPGTNIVADTGHSYQILVNGALRAAGKFGSPITFKARYSKPYGQLWNCISDTAVNGKIILDSVIVRDATSGIYAAGSNDTIQRSTLINNYNGVNLNGSALTLSNVLIDSSRYGIYSYYASPKILNTTIRRCYEGIYGLGGSPGPGIRYCTITACSDYGIYGGNAFHLTTRPVSQTDSGRNVISKNQSGIYMGPNASFFFGNSSGYGSWNSIDSSTWGFDFYILTGASMTAEYNFWGGSPRFYFGQPPTWLDSAHALRSDPNPGRLGKMDGVNVPVVSSDTLEMAYEDLSSEDYQDALLLYGKVLKSEPGTMRGRRALLGIIQTYEESNKADFLTYLQQNVQPIVSAQSDFPIILKQAQARWFAKTGRPTDAIAILQALRKEYGATNQDVEKYSLFDIGVISLNELSDAAQARSTFGLLRSEFPSDNLSDISSILLALGPMPSLKKAPGGDQNTLTGTPKLYSLAQNFPNPFNPSTTIRFSLPEPGNVSLEVYNVLGEKVAVLASGTHTPGLYTAVWDARNCGSGVYFVRLIVRNDLGSAQYSKTNKVLLLK